MTAWQSCQFSLPVKRHEVELHDDAFPLWKLCSIGICSVCDCLQMFGTVSIIVINRYINLLGRTNQEIKKPVEQLCFPELSRLLNLDSGPPWRSDCPSGGISRLFRTVDNSIGPMFYYVLGILITSGILYWILLYML